jgi:cytochrome c556
MSKCKWLTFAGLLLALGVWAAPTGKGADDEEDKEAIKAAQKDVLKLMDTMGNGGNGKADAAAIRKKFAELKPSMYIFKPRKNGGLGIGPPMQGDGIELKIGFLANPKKPLAKADAARQMDDFILMANVSKAIAEIADLYPPKKDKEDWKQYDQDMRKGADKLIAAAKTGDPKEIKKAAIDLNASCTNCHSKFRDE